MLLYFNSSIIFGAKVRRFLHSHNPAFGAFCILNVWYITQKGTFLTLLTGFISLTAGTGTGP